MKKIILIQVFILTLSAIAFAQDDRQAAINVVNQLFDGMKAKNAVQIKAVFASDEQLVDIDKPRDSKGLSKTRPFTGEAFAKMISEAKGAEYIEKMRNL